MRYDTIIKPLISLFKTSNRFLGNLILEQETYAHQLKTVAFDRLFKEKFATLTEMFIPCWGILRKSTILINLCPWKHDTLQAK